MTRYIDDGSVIETHFETFRAAGDLFWEIMYGPKNKIAIGVFAKIGDTEKYFKVQDIDLLYWHEIKIPELMKR